MVAELKNEMLSMNMFTSIGESRTEKRKFIHSSPKISGKNNHQGTAFAHVRKSSTKATCKISSEWKEVPKKVTFVEKNYKIVKEMSLCVTLRSNDQEHFAVKKYALKTMLQDQKLAIVNELLLQRCLAHPSLVNVYDSYCDHHVVLVTSYAGDSLQ